MQGVLFASPNSKTQNCKNCRFVLCLRILVVTILLVLIFAVVHKTAIYRKVTAPFAIQKQTYGEASDQPHFFLFGDNSNSSHFVKEEWYSYLVYIVESGHHSSTIEIAFISALNNVA